MSSDTTLKVNEIFYSLQGEGQRAGSPSVFIRLSGCSAKWSCLAHGVKCDTEFESGREMGVNDIIYQIQPFACPDIIWTGGEPLDQLTPDILRHFIEAGFRSHLETSGVRPLHGYLGPMGGDPMFQSVTLSPKVAEHVIKKHFPDGSVDELRYVRSTGQGIPDPVISGAKLYLSPMFDGDRPNWENINHCIQLCKEDPSWSLSIQVHKLLNIR